MSDVAQPPLEIRAANGQTSRFPVTSGRVIIGRSDQATVKLDSGLVSRQHCEIFTDTFGRWWIKDLKSRNGTLLNGKAIIEELISPGDTIQVEDFTIFLKLPGASGAEKRGNAGGGINFMETGVAPIKRLRDLETPKIAATHFSLLSEFGANLLKTPDAAERMKMLCRLMVSPEFHGTTAVTFRLDRTSSDDTQADVLCAPESSKNWRKGELPYVSRTLLRAVRANLAPVVASNAGATGAIELSLAGNVTQMAATACPIHVDDKKLDILYVAFPSEFGTTEWLALASLAAERFAQAETTLLNQQQAQEQALMDSELAKANAIQMRLIPRELTFEGVEVGIGFEPCKWVGGDYVDAIQDAEGKMLFIMGDVCGKGMQAALITATLHATVHTSALGKINLVDLMGRLNEYLVQTLPDESFVTMMGMLLDPKTGDLEVINAGHPPAMVADASGKVRQLQAGANLPLGYVPLPHEVASEKLQPGELLVVYTDGCNEMVNEQNDMLGIDRLATMIEKLYSGRGATAVTELGDHFKQLLDEFQGDAEPADDRTFLLVRRKA